MEFTFLRKPNFFPNRDEALARQDRICIGTKSRNLGDALLITPLARALKVKHPHVKIQSFGRGFNPVVFCNNPYVQGQAILPDAVFGDDCLWGSGHIIELMQSFFRAPLTGQVKPEVYLSKKERAWAAKALPQDGMPLCFVHTSGFTWKNLMPLATWERLLAPFSGRVRFIQVGIYGDHAIPSAQPWFLPRSPWSARKLFALMERADAFIGMDSGPMHVARAFEIPSCILVKGGDAEKVFAQRKVHPHFLHGNWKFSNWYEGNTHVNVDDSELETKLGEFLDRLNR